MARAAVEALLIATAVAAATTAAAAAAAVAAVAVAAAVAAGQGRGACGVVEGMGGRPLGDLDIADPGGGTGEAVTGGYQLGGCGRGLYLVGEALSAGNAGGNRRGIEVQASTAGYLGCLAVVVRRGASHPRRGPTDLGVRGGREIDARHLLDCARDSLCSGRAPCAPWGVGVGGGAAAVVPAASVVAAAVNVVGAAAAAREGGGLLGDVDIAGVGGGAGQAEVLMGRAPSVTGGRLYIISR
ncbi:hypothetical protein PG985_015082 [Apiospora marii]|uniref:Secreted protein n=1 Tax=Apiospora marii TaxID=335849 RepID=A0ABR1RMA2_9PEZI